MANTFIKIETITVGTAIASITFSSIPQTYTDLQLVISSRTSRASDSDGMFLTFNSVTTGYTHRYALGSGTAAISGNSATRYIGETPGNNAVASIFGNARVYIPNYTSANNKSYSVDAVAEDNDSSAYVSLVANLWSNTAAITSIAISPEAGPNLNQYTSATLYGIKSS
jgi:hypothetical protein